MARSLARMCTFHSLDRVFLPQPFQRSGQGLTGHAAIGVAGGFGEDVGAGIALRLERGGDALVRQHPVVQRSIDTSPQPSPRSRRRGRSA